MDRVAAAKQVLDRLDEPKQSPRIDPFRDYRLRQAGETKAASDYHRATQQKILDTPSRPNQTRRADWGSLSPTQTKAKSREKEPDKKRSQEKVRDDTNTCKPRPTQNRGSGGSRNFVPWCDRNKR